MSNKKYRKCYDHQGYTKENEYPYHDDNYKRIMGKKVRKYNKPFLVIVEHYPFDLYKALVTETQMDSRKNTDLLNTMILQSKKNGQRCIALYLTAVPFPSWFDLIHRRLIVICINTQYHINSKSTSIMKLKINELKPLGLTEEDYELLGNEFIALLNSKESMFLFNILNTLSRGFRNEFESFG